ARRASLSCASRRLQKKIKIYRTMLRVALALARAAQKPEEILPKNQSTARRAAQETETQEIVAV
ncbi:hypothetical protein A2U01_0102301, partial [Trifolium medium]|nr:hypothetical protein [Trifolium medium]